MNINVIETKLRGKIEEMDILTKKDEMNEDEVRAWEALKQKLLHLKNNLREQRLKMK